MDEVNINQTKNEEFQTGIAAAKKAKRPLRMHMSVAWMYEKAY